MVFITARVFLEGTPVMGTYGFHYCPGVLGGETYYRYEGREEDATYLTKKVIYDVESRQENGGVVGQSRTSLYSLKGKQKVKES
ncbi:hypothetical protein Tco_1116764, partial [Tanacetum coccineum]